MSDQIDSKFKRVLESALGVDGHISDLIVKFLQDQTSSSSGNSVDLWREWQTQIGYGTAQFNDNMMAWFRANGLDKQYNDNFLQALIDGLFNSSRLLKEDGGQLLLEDGVSSYLLEN